MRKTFLVALVVAFGWVPEAGAQYLPLEGKLYVDVNALYQATSQTVDQRGTFSRYDEEGTFEARQRVRGGALWQIGFGYTFWRELSLGFDVSQFTRSPGLTLSGTVPHPLFFNTLRAFETGASSSHKTRMIALMAAWRVRLRGPLERVNLRVMVGPAHVRAYQRFATGGTITETGSPFSTVDVTANVERLSKNSVGVIGGVDVGYPFHDNIAVGMLLRYAGGSVKFNEQLGGQTIRVNAGGFQVGGGVRLRF